MTLNDHNLTNELSSAIVQPTLSSNNNANLDKKWSLQFNDSKQKEKIEEFLSKF